MTVIIIIIIICTIISTVLLLLLLLLFFSIITIIIISSSTTIIIISYLRLDEPRMPRMHGCARCALGLRARVGLRPVTPPRPGGYIRIAARIYSYRGAYGWVYPY